jgi:hypothetical protein
MQNKTIFGLEIAYLRYSMVKLPRAERGDKRNIIMRIAEQERKRKEFKRL